MESDVQFIIDMFSCSLGASVMLAELAVEAGLPNGVLNIVHGTNVRLEIGPLFCYQQYIFPLKILQKKLFLLVYDVISSTVLLTSVFQTVF